MAVFQRILESGCSRVNVQYQKSRRIGRKPIKIRKVELRDISVISKTNINASPIRAARLPKRVERYRTDIAPIVIGDTSDWPYHSVRHRVPRQTAHPDGKEPVMTTRLMFAGALALVARGLAVVAFMLMASPPAVAEQPPQSQAGMAADVRIGNPASDRLGPVHRVEAGGGRRAPQSPAFDRLPDPERCRARVRARGRFRHGCRRGGGGAAGVLPGAGDVRGRAHSRRCPGGPGRVRTPSWPRSQRREPSRSHASARSRWHTRRAGSKPLPRPTRPGAPRPAAAEQTAPEFLRSGRTYRWSGMKQPNPRAPRIPTVAPSGRPASGAVSRRF